LQALYELPFRNDFAFRGFMRNIRIGLNESTFFDRADTNTFFVIKDLWLLMTEEEKKIISKR